MQAHTEKSALIAYCFICADDNLLESIDLIKDRRHAEWRLLLIEGLFRSKNPLAKQAIDDLADDPDLKLEIAAYCKRREARERRKKGKS